MESTCLQSLLGGRDLTDPAHGRDRFQDLITRIHEGVAEATGCSRQILRLPLWESTGFGERRRLRARRSLVPGVVELLRSQALEPPDDRLLLAPGPVYRDDRASRGERRHELLLVRLASGRASGVTLADLVRTALSAAGLTTGVRLLPQAGELAHGLRVESAVAGGWQALGYCGLVRDGDLERAGLQSAGHGATAVNLALEPLAEALGEKPGEAPGSPAIAGVLDQNAS